MVKDEPSVLAEGLGLLGRLIQPLQAGRQQTLAALLALGLRGFQLIAQRHEFIDFGNDAVLFGEGWECNWNPIHTILWKSTTSSSSLFIKNKGLEIGRKDKAMKEVLSSF